MTPSLLQTEACTNMETQNETCEYHIRYAKHDHKICLKMQPNFCIYRNNIVIIEIYYDKLVEFSYDEVDAYSVSDHALHRQANNHICSFLAHRLLIRYDECTGGVH